MMTEHFGGNVEVLYTAALMVLISALLTFAIVPLMAKEPKFPKIPDKPVQDKTDLTESVTDSRNATDLKTIEQTSKLLKEE